jgi:hypothetical protein
MTNKIFAIPAAAPAIPAKPSNAANNATIKNVTDQPNIIFPFSFELTGQVVFSGYQASLFAGWFWWKTRQQWLGTPRLADASGSGERSLQELFKGNLHFAIACISQ